MSGVVHRRGRGYGVDLVHRGGRAAHHIGRISGSELDVLADIDAEVELRMNHREAAQAAAAVLEIVGGGGVGAIVGQGWRGDGQERSHGRDSRLPRRRRGLA